MRTCPLNSSLFLSWLRSIWMVGESFDVGGGDSDRAASYQEWPGAFAYTGGWLSPARLTQDRMRRTTPNAGIELAIGAIWLVPIAPRGRSFPR
jgi:hypothetical protein